MKILCVICLLQIYSIAECQTTFKYGEILDNRDGKRYETVEIGNAVWLAENMRYKTENSVDYSENDFNLELKGHYYPVEETDEVCPNGFEIPDVNQWENYIKVLFELKEIPTSSVEKLNKKIKHSDLIGIVNPIEQLQFFKEPNPLMLKESGHTQGKGLISIETMNFWIKNGNSTDPKYHVHIEPNLYWIHSHKHNIIARKKKKRNFVVRCVKIK